MVEYILGTKFWNEKENLPILLESIASQSLKPRMMLFVDDGSIDGSGNIATEKARDLGLDCRIVSLPGKTKGNLDTLGRAWNVAQPLIKEILDDIDFFATTDVDTRYPKNYFEIMTNYLISHPNIGVVAGQISGAPRRTFPMFTGKVVRSEIVRSIDKYWDVSIDSFLNVKALKMGYNVKILDDIFVEAPISHLRTEKGRYRAGRLAYYGGSNILYAITKAVASFDSQFLRGYWFEFFKGTWRCDDEDMLEYYRKEFLRKMLKTLKIPIRY
ncbi:MAG: glycosyltransferase [Candidatus Thorarchaeota archaeon]